MKKSKYKPKKLILRKILYNFKIIGRKLGFSISFEDKLNDFIARGMKIGKDVIISPGTMFDELYPYLISIGDNSILCTGTRLISHDSTIISMTGGYLRLGKIDIKENCIIGLNVIILPGVTIGPNAIVASGSVVNKDIPPNSCVAGVPARFYAKYQDVQNKYKEEIQKGPVFLSVDLSKDEDEFFIERKLNIIKNSQKGNVWIKGRESRNPKKVKDKIYGDH